MKLNYIIFSIAISFLVGCNNSSKVVNIEIDNYTLLDSVFTEHNNIDSSHIPPIFVNNISASIKDLTISERKTTFIRILLANIVKNNNHILSQRDSIINISNKKNISKVEKNWLDNIYKTYRCKPYNTDELLINVDIIPPSMAIAQAIVESGWGTSKFAIEGNSLFGEHFSNGANGKYIPASGSNIKLKAFPSIYGAVKSYSININRHRAYRKFRAMRLEMRKNNVDLNSIELIETLGSYSELGDEYILYIKNIINKNSLQKFDAIELSNTTTKYSVNIIE